MCVYIYIYMCICLYICVTEVARLVSPEKPPLRPQATAWLRKPIIVIMLSAKSTHNITQQHKTLHLIIAQHITKQTAPI